MDMADYGIGQRTPTSVEVSYNNELSNNFLPCSLIAVFGYVNMIMTSLSLVQSAQDYIKP